MSLINEMLKDLESRQAGITSGGAVVADLGAVDSPLQRERGGPAKYLVPLLLVAALALAVTISAPIRVRIAALFEQAASQSVTLLRAAGMVRSGATRFGVPAGADPRPVAATRERPAEVVRAAPATGSKTPPGRVTAALERRPLARPLAKTVATLAPPVRAYPGLRLSARLVAPDSTPVPGGGVLTGSEGHAAPAAPHAGPGTHTAAQQATVTSARPVAAAHGSRPAPSFRHPPVPPEHATDRPGVRKRALPPSPHERAETAYREGVALLRRGEYEAGDARLREALRSAPDHVAARELLAARLVDRGRNAAAERLLREGLEAGAAAPRLARIYARLLVERGDVAGALKALDGALPRAGGGAEYLAFRGALLERLGRYAEAVRDYRAALATQPRRPEWWLGYGLALEAVGKRTAALRAYRRAASGPGLTPAVRRFVNGKLTAPGE